MSLVPAKCLEMRETGPGASEMPVNDRPNGSAPWQGREAGGVKAHRKALAQNYKVKGQKLAGGTMQYKTREAIRYLKERGVKISYSHFLKLMHKGAISPLRKASPGCAYLYREEDLNRFILHWKNGKGKKINWTDNCPFHNGSIQSYIPGISPLSADFCPLI